MTFGLAALFLIAAGYIWLTFIGPQAAAVKFGPESAALDYALQDNDRIPERVLRDLTAINEPQSANNLYWGELHIHTSESFDAALFGNTIGVEDTYRFAKGEPIVGVGGESMQLSRPLDFVAITDHAEGFGTRTHCSDEGLTLGSEQLAGSLMSQIHGYSKFSPVEYAARRSQATLHCLAACTKRSNTNHRSPEASLPVDLVRVPWSDVMRTPSMIGRGMLLPLTRFMSLAC